MLNGVHSEPAKQPGQLVGCRDKDWHRASFPVEPAGDGHGKSPVAAVLMSPTVDLTTPRFGNTAPSATDATALRWPP
jgi:hypothetical protein